MQPLRKLFFVTLATLALGFTFSTSQVAYAQQVEPAEDDVVINEFVVNPTTGKEYVELLVTKPGGVNMQGWTLSDLAARTTTPPTTTPTEGDVILPAAEYLANVPQGTFVVIVFVTPTANTNTLTEDTSTTDGNRRLVLIIGSTAGLTTTGQIDHSTNDNLQLYAGSRATGTLIDQVLAGNNTSLVAGASWGDNSTTAPHNDNINAGSSIPSNASVRFVPTADTLAAYQDNDTGARFVVQAASYGTPGAPNTGVPGDASIFSAGGAPLIISEFRLQGPTGTCDEFIEIYNTSDEPYTVQSLNAGSTGFSVVSSNGPTVLFTIPNGDTIPARGHYLGVNNGTLCTSGGSYSSGTYPAGNGTTATGDRNFVSGDTPLNTGIALFNNSSATGFTDGNRLDAVGPTSETNALYREGAGYPPLDVFAQENFLPNYSIYRDLRSGLPKDTNDNDADFDAVNTNGTELCASTTNFACKRLGAPGPENLSSPIQRNANIKASLIDPNCTGMAVNPVLPSACRFERRTGAESGAGSSPTNFGTLSIRRRFTNSTGAPVTRLRFRIVDITNFPEAELGNGSGLADLRAISSSTVTAFCQSESGVFHVCTDTGTPTTDIEGTTLEVDEHGQENGGGFNSTLTLPNQLADGAAINLQFMLGVEANGFFRFFVNVEALTAAPAPPAAATKAQATGKARASKLKK